MGSKLYSIHHAMSHIDDAGAKGADTPSLCGRSEPEPVLT